MIPYRKKLICLNCDTQGHAFRNCELPVRSYGIIAYKNTPEGNKFLLIQRKDTIGKTDFIRGKYKINGKISYHKLKCLIEEMTDMEKLEILNNNKEDLWENLWIDRSIGIYKNEKYKAMKTIEEIDYRSLLLESMPSRYSQNEWGFPKGRKNLSESGMQCAIREFKEETGLVDTDFVLNFKAPCFVEEFTASDGIVYTHVYYLAKVNNYTRVDVHNKNNLFHQEVRNIGFFDFRSAYKSFRDYDTEKRKILSKVDKYLWFNCL